MKLLYPEYTWVVNSSEWLVLIDNMISKVKEIYWQNGATFNLLHQEWKVYEPYRPGQ